jgi:hypothetical protein
MAKPRYLVAEFRRIMVQGSLGKKLVRLILNQQLGAMVRACHSSYVGSIIGGLWLRLTQAKTRNLIPKGTKIGLGVCGSRGRAPA